MKLWMVMYVAGKIGATWGPLPYDMIECQARRADMVSDLQPVRALPSGLTTADIKFECEEHDLRPTLDLSLNRGGEGNG